LTWLLQARGSCLCVSRGVTFSQKVGIPPPFPPLSSYSPPLRFLPLRSLPFRSRALNRARGSGGQGECCKLPQRGRLGRAPAAHAFLHNFSSKMAASCSAYKWGVEYRNSRERVGVRVRVVSPTITPVRSASCVEAVRLQGSR